MMKKFVSFLAASFLLTACGTPSGDDARNSLRAPAWPLVTIDPYTSAWSMSDRLYDEPVKHWTGTEFPLLGVLEVDGVNYRFMGTEDLELMPLAPTSEQEVWMGRYTTDEPAGAWEKPGYDDSAWALDRGAFGTKINEPTAQTDWTTERIWVRRTFTLDEVPDGRPLYLEYCNDDDAVFYLNGVEIHNTGSVCHKHARVRIPAEAVATLRQGENLLAAKCINPVGNGLLDFGILTPKERRTLFGQSAEQLWADVQATRTIYRFACGSVDLQLTFSAPLFLDDLETMSRPVNYMTYEIVSNDGKPHTLRLYVEAAPGWAVDQPYQASASECFERNGLVYLKTGSREQRVLAKAGDDLRIDWGHFYMAADAANATAGVGESAVLRRGFAEGDTSGWKNSGEQARMALALSLGETETADGKLMIGYDDGYSIQYFGQNLRPYWNRKGDRTIFDAFETADAQYEKLLKRCERFDAELMAEATAAGGRHYAELCALAYRQAIAAHKLVESPEGDLLFFSKENNSNGSIGTVDITYPSMPLFLKYNPELVAGLMNHIYHYSESGRWTKPFPAHDVGTYPLANGQTYGGDMPVEEAGNMLIATAAMCHRMGDASYARRHWAALTTWTDYLVEHGLDPENQLCTDDFAGHFAHNVNLSVKAILGIASYGRMASMLGMEEVAERYTAKARELAAEWVKMADDGDHYRLTFDKPGTWSQKYNLVWDKLLGLDIFPDSVARTEVASYLGRQNEYGLPLDSREAYTKSDFILWTATMADDRAAFEAFIDPLHHFYNTTVDRVPMSDWIWTDRPNHRGFKTRSVVGGYFIKMLDNE